jgi:hypothetical protein
LDAGRLVDFFGLLDMAFSSPPPGQAILSGALKSLSATGFASTSFTGRSVAGNGLDVVPALQLTAVDDVLKIARLIAKIAKRVTGNVGNPGILAVQRLLER